MSRSALLHLVSVALMATVGVTLTEYARSQDAQTDTESVAAAARRAREQKKAGSKPVRVFTDDDVRPAPPEAATKGTPSGATVPAADAKTEGSSEASDKNAAGESTAEAAKDSEKSKESKEITKLREQVKQAQSDLDLLQRELSLDQDVVYSKTDYTSDTAGLAKLATEKQQVSDKLEELNRLKAKLADLLKSEGSSSSAGAKP